MGYWANTLARWLACACATPLDLEISLEKQEEAMEAGYRFESRHRVQ